MAVASIAFHITDRCQLDCEHCLRDPGLKPKDLSLDIVRKAITEARAIYGTRHVALTGGEPTLHPEFTALIDLIVGQGMTWHMVSNARRFEQTFAMLKAVPARLRAVTAMDFSLDGADEATHDGIRGAGSFREVMTASMICAANKIPFVLQMAVNAKNIHQIEAFALLAANLGAKRASYGILQATGTHHDEKLYITPAATREALERILRLHGVLKIEVMPTEGFPTEEAFHVCTPWRSEQLHIDLDGRLNLCCQHAGIPGSKSDVAGDLHDVSLAEAHRKLLGIIHEVQADKVARLASGAPKSAWDGFHCNECLRFFGKPHWEDDAAAGPAAQRERWRGAWAKTRLPVVG
jgi:MoaA/NifB/PqqE/SkfB family radical SAM enzyme